MMSDSVQKHNASLPEVLITPAAQAHFLRYLAEDKQNLGVRLSVKKAGCSGYSYLVDYVNELPLDHLSLPLNANYQLFIPQVDRRFFQGLKIDLVKQGLNSKLTFTNPLQTGQCGCGESFIVDF